mmetsp:Transcript_23861/g.59266  ORF Transcript_23861/g.59266 Transcript_23861/m.59266 type:complete len:259 (+) Transcript_23861:193-969(+)
MHPAPTKESVPRAGGQAPSPGLQRILTSLGIPNSSSVLSCEAAASMDVDAFGDRTEDVREWVFHELAARADWGSSQPPAAATWPVVVAHAAPACSTMRAVVEAHAASATSAAWPVVDAHTASYASTVVRPVVEAHTAATTAAWPVMDAHTAPAAAANECTTLVAVEPRLLAQREVTSAIVAASALIRTDVLASEELDIERAVAEFLDTVPSTLLLHSASALPAAERVATRRRHLLTCGAGSVRAGTSFVVRARMAPLL